MNHITYKISLDMRQTESNVVVKMKRDDTIKKLAISLTDGGKPYHITEECRAVFAGKKPDGTILLNPCTIEDCVVTYEVTLQTEAVLGEVKSEIRLYGAEGELGSSPSFTVLIVPPIYDAELVIESHDEVNALTDLITSANGMIQKGEEVAQRGEAIFASLQDKEEALDARAEEVFGDLLEAKETLVSDANRIFNGFQDKQEELVAEAKEVFDSMPETYVSFTNQKLTDEQKAQARENIGAGSKVVEDALSARLANGSITLEDERGGTATTLFLDRENLSMDTPGGKERVLTSGYMVLTPEQQTRARENIGAASKNEIVKTAVLYESQDLTPEQSKTARRNINAAGLDDLQDLENRFDEAEERIPTAKTYELIATTTVEEDDPKGSVTFNVDSNGNPFELTDFIIQATAAFVDGNKSTLYMNVNKATIINNGSISSLGNIPRTFQIFFRSENDGCKRVEFTGSMMNNTYFNPQWTLANSRLVSPIAGYNLDTITEIKLFTLLPSDGAKEWVVGSTFELWGVRK